MERLDETTSGELAGRTDSLPRSAILRRGEKYLKGEQERNPTWKLGRRCRCLAGNLHTNARECAVSEEKTVHTFGFDVFMAGDLAQAKQVCREYCFAIGLCVTVEPLDFIYTGGEEAGFKIGLINYPRFPTTIPELRRRATELADLLMKRLCQHSYSIVGPDETTWISRRPENLR